MAKDIIIRDAKGANVPVDLSVSLYKDAADAGLSLKQHLANIYPTNVEKNGSAFEQLLDQCGILVRGNKELLYRFAEPGPAKASSKSR